MSKKAYTAPEAEIEKFDYEISIYTFTVSGIEGGGNNEWDFGEF